VAPWDAAKARWPINFHLNWGSRFSVDIVRKQLSLSPETSVQISFGEGLHAAAMNKATYRQLELLRDMNLKVVVR
jgi:hypothetical protein